MNQTYEQAVAELKQIAEYLEQEDLDVDLMMEKSARASVLLDFCRQKLFQAEEDLRQLFPDQSV
jgi:exodeoxyribonuclease VII small subunit